MNKNIEWLIFVTTLPTRNTAARMRLWRAVNALGAATLRDGVYLLPLRAPLLKSLNTLAADVRQADGSAEILQVAADALQEAAFPSLFDRTEQYAAFVIQTQASTLNEKLLRRLTRELDALTAIDYFPGEAREQAQSALNALAVRLSPDEPATVSGQIPRYFTADFSGKTWATRKQLWVDRMASAWLIRRFIDPNSQFLWLDKPADCPGEAIGFDFDGAVFSHVGGRVTFEVLAASFALEGDPAIVRIAAIVHSLDAGGIPVAEAPGIEAVLAGLRTVTLSDDELLVESARIFDSLYVNYQTEN